MKKILISLLTVAAFTSCSKSENTGNDTPNDGAIRVFTGIDTPGTKALATQAVGLSGVQFIKIDGSTTTDFSSTVSGYHPTTGSVEASSGKVTFNSTPSYNMDDSEAWLVAYYPVGASENNVITWAINGSTDVLRTDAAWDAGNYATPLTGSEGTKLTLNHQLSQVEVICKAENSSALTTVRAAWGQIKSIEFLSAPAEMTYTLNGLTIANSATTSDFLLLKNYDDADNTFEAIDIPANDNATANAVAMLAPVDATATESFKLKITSEGPTAEVSDDLTQTMNVSLGGNLTPMSKGHKHVITLTFKADSKNIVVDNTTIEAWTNGAIGSNEVVKP